MTYTVRRYRPDTDDLARMTALIQDAWLPERRADALFHIGDLYWRLRIPAYEQNLWLWENGAGELAAFVQWDAEGAQLEFQTHPRHTSSGLEADILAWAEDDAPRPQMDNAVALTLTTYAAETDAAFLALLTTKGYRQDDHAIHCDYKYRR